MSLALFHDTIVAASTPPGKSALAIVRLSGPEAIRIVGSIAEDSGDVWTLRSGCSQHVNLVADGEPIDDVVVHVFRSPATYTGEDLVEITSHGSPVIVERIIEATRSCGARLAEPGEFSRRAFWNGKITLEQAELIPLKIESSSSVELRGVERGLREKFEVLRSAYDSLISLVAQIDAEIDFGESDEVVIDALPSSLDDSRRRLSALLDRSSTRKLNSGYFTVALVGPPNVGKSSLFNALLRTERSIVSDTPGTTRDYLEAYIEIEGMPVKLIDTAGIREAEESIEERGIALGRSAALDADLVLRLTDPESRNVQASSGEVLVHNKSDLDCWSTGIAISSVTGSGLRALHRFIAERLTTFGSELSRPRLLESERDALVSVVSRLEGIDLSLEPPMLSEELRSIAETIGQMLGLTTSVESLNYIFASMCIGK